MGFSLTLLAIFTLTALPSAIKSQADRSFAINTVKESSKEQKLLFKKEAIRILRLEEIDKVGYWQMTFVADKGFKIEDKYKIRTEKMHLTYDEVMSFLKIIGLDSLRFYNHNQQFGAIIIILEDNTSLNRDIKNELTYKVLRGNLRTIIKHMHLTAGPSHHFSRGFREILVSGTGEDCCVSSCTR